MSVISRQSINLSVEVRVLSLNSDGFLTLRCPSCSSSDLKVEEPWQDEPDRLLGLCRNTGCRHWFLIEISEDSREATVVELPASMRVTPPRRVNLTVESVEVSPFQSQLDTVLLPAGVP